MSVPLLHFYDHNPSATSLSEEVLHGLVRRPKSIPPKFFYDDRGSRLFDKICDQPEYYPTRTEIRLLKDNAKHIAELVGRDCMLIELGSGSNQKVRLLLDILKPAAYVPVDISRDYLLQEARAVAEDYPWLRVYAACADFSQALQLPRSAVGARKVAFFPGSSIGNFEPGAARALLANIARLVQPGGALLIGADLKKDPAVLNAAYNDAQGITAAFNLNLLRRINRELNANFKLDQFAHQAFYNARQGRIEMHLVSRVDQTVRIAGRSFEFTAGESIHTENSYKYDPGEFEAMVAAAGFNLVQWWTDTHRRFGVFYFTPRP